MAERSGPPVTFLGLLASVMVALRLKEGWDDYKQVSTTNEESAHDSPAAYRDVEGEEAISLINTDITVARPKRKRAKCCVCCGLDCGLFWKAFAIVLALFALWNAFKLISWAVTPKPTGLENMPEFSTSLGCMSAPYIYTGEPVSFAVPFSEANAEHGIDMLHGGAVGTITLHEGAPTETRVRYEVTIRTDNKALLENVLLNQPPAETGKPVTISTPALTEGSCMRYDLKMFIPPNLKKLHVRSHTVTHLQFDPESQIQLDALFVSFFTSDSRNMVIPHTNLRAHQTVIELYDGWVVGDIAIQGTTKLTTQRGQAVLNVRVHPTAPLDPAAPEPALLRTTTGAGRTDIFYIEHEGHVHRPISNVHISSKNAPLYLTYRDSQYNGLIELGSKSFTATGVQKLAPAPVDGTWTHAVGDPQGVDQIVINSRGWTGLYF